MHKHIHVTVKLNDKNIINTFLNISISNSADYLLKSIIHSSNEAWAELITLGSHLILAEPI